MIERNKELIDDNRRMHSQNEQLQIASSSVPTLKRDHDDLVRQKDLIILDLEQ